MKTDVGESMRNFNSTRLRYKMVYCQNDSNRMKVLIESVESEVDHNNRLTRLTSIGLWIFFTPTIGSLTKRFSTPLPRP